MQMLNEDSGSFMKFSLEQRSLNELAKLCWGESILKTTIDVEDHSIPAKLITHRKSVINNLPQILKNVEKGHLANIPGPIMNKLIDAVFRVEQGYVEVLSWEERCRSSLPFTILDPVTAGEYQAGYFIDPSGHFDDLAWVKRFVAHDNQFIHSRFEFACLYCFEEKIRDMWYFMKTKRQLPCKGRLDFIEIVCDATVGIWAYKLENEFDFLPVQGRRYGSFIRSDNIYVHGLVTAIFEGHEYAVQYFWSQCRKTESFSILNTTDDFVGILSYVSSFNYTGVLHFLYSNLSEEEKIRAFVLNNESRKETAEVWSCLLLSPFYECALADIVSNIYPIPAVIYESLLTSLARKVKESEIPIHKKVLRELWNHLSQMQRNEILKIHGSRDKRYIDVLENLN